MRSKKPLLTKDTHFNYPSQVGECRWSKGGKPVGMFGGKYEMRGATDQGDCSLTLYSLDLRIDDGQWQCQVSRRHFDFILLSQVMSVLTKAEYK